MAKKTIERRTSAGSDLAPLKLEAVGDFVKRSMHIYGSEVNEDRAVPSFQDGFKPVQRRLLWASSKVASSTSATGKVKSAMPVAESMGKYHPHSDSSLYGALVTMVNGNTPTMIGLGNWGSLIDPPAAMRYTNTHMSKYGATFLQRDYLAVTPKVPNYDSTLEEPLYLPALLPNVFMNAAEGIGVGVRTGLPAYTPDSLIRMCIRLLNREELTAGDWAKGLVFYNSWGAELVKTKDNMSALKDFYKTSGGTVAFFAPVEFDEVKKQILINKFVPGVRIESSEKKRNEKDNKKESGLGVIDKIKRMPIVDNIDSGQGLAYIVQCKKTANVNECKALHAKIQSMFTVKQSYNIFVTERQPDVDGKYKVTFHNCSVPEVLVKWLKFRVRLEVNALTWRITELEKAIAYTELMIHACDHIDALIKIVRRKPALNKDEICRAFMKLLKVDEASAKQVMDLRLHQLSALDQNELEAKLKEQNKALKILQKDVKQPVRVVKEYLESMIGKFKPFNGTNPQQHQWIL